jgi:hypothetical protein
MVSAIIYDMEIADQLVGLSSLMTINLFVRTGLSGSVLGLNGD